MIFYFFSNLAIFLSKGFVDSSHESIKKTLEKNTERPKRSIQNAKMNELLKQLNDIRDSPRREKNGSILEPIFVVIAIDYTCTFFLILISNRIIDKRCRT
jgi:translation elongation factor EF-Tu-like GTPase